LRSLPAQSGLIPAQSGPQLPQSGLIPGQFGPLPAQLRSLPAHFGLIPDQLRPHPARFRSENHCGGAGQARFWSEKARLPGCGGSARGHTIVPQIAPSIIAKRFAGRARHFMLAWIQTCNANMLCLPGGRGGKSDAYVAADARSRPAGLAADYALKLSVHLGTAGIVAGDVTLSTPIDSHHAGAAFRHGIRPRRDASLS
jgi:hypothetical protein